MVFGNKCVLDINDKYYLCLVINISKKELVNFAWILMIANPKSPAHNMESETQGFTEMDYCCRRVCVPGENMPK